MNIFMEIVEPSMEQTPEMTPTLQMTETTRMTSTRATTRSRYKKTHRQLKRLTYWDKRIELEILPRYRHHPHGLVLRDSPYRFRVTHGPPAEDTIAALIHYILLLKY